MSLPPTIATGNQSIDLGDGSNAAKIRVKPWFTDSTGKFSGKQSLVSLTTEPNNTNNTPFVRYAIAQEGGGSPDITKPLATSITTIESIGSYGNTKRKIVAKVDRSSGNVVGIFDYVIYSATDLCKPSC